jgi:alpha-methylacyl-CoA racemase
MRILDLSRLLPGPYCSRILADFGFEVIKVERPGGGDWSRYVPPLDPESGEGLLFRALNRGKQSLTLNLKSDAGRAILLQLVQGADVLLESFRPGVMERLGMGYESLAGANPGLIYCSLSGYGPSGPYRARAGHDLNFQGIAGALDLTGPRAGPLSVPGVPLADLSGALWAALGILLALLERQRSGRGQRIDSSLLGGALSCLPVAVAWQRGGQPIARGASEFTGGAVCYNIYETRDGRYMTLSALEPEFWAAFCQAVGRPNLLGEQFAPAVSGHPVYDDLCTLFRSHTLQEWVEILRDVDACCEPVYPVGEALASPPVQALGMLAEGALLPPLRFSDLQPRSPARSAALGEHTGALLAELGYGEADIRKLRADGVV